MFLGMQDFDFARILSEFAQILLKFAQISLKLTQILPNFAQIFSKKIPSPPKKPKFPKFSQKNFLGDTAASPTLKVPRASHFRVKAYLETLFSGFFKSEIIT